METKTQRQLLKTNRGTATDDDGQRVFVDEYTDMHRTQFLDATWSNWTAGNRRFSVEGADVFPVDEFTFRSPSGCTFRVTQWGQRNLTL